MDESVRSIRVQINGRWRSLQVEGDRTLARVLREELGLTGTKINCEQGECGACTVLLDGEAVNACLVLAARLDGRAVTTIEGLAVAGRLDPLQEAFLQHDALQCGFCTPGMILSARALLLRNPDPDPLEIREALAGNWCRCTGYRSIVAAVQQAARTYRERKERP